jgi:hypothetical protein
MPYSSHIMLAGLRHHESVEFGLSLVAQIHIWPADHCPEIFRLMEPQIAATELALIQSQTFLNSIVVSVSTFWSSDG